MGERFFSPCRFNENNLLMDISAFNHSVHCASCAHGFRGIGMGFQITLGSTSKSDGKLSPVFTVKIDTTPQLIFSQYGNQAQAQ